MKNLKTIDIQSKEWFDKVNENSYFSGEITLNFGMKDEKTFKMPFQYGYGDAYLQESVNRLIEHNIVSLPPYSRLQAIREMGIILRYSKHENCLKRDVVSFGKD